jgi:pyridoxamine 5'-phosphate oxidase family protein
MSKFTREEIAYLQGLRIGRLATVGASGEPHVVPMVYRFNPEHESIDIGGHNFTNSKKYRDALRHGQVAIVIDDSPPSGGPRFVEVRGTAEALSTGGQEISPNFPPEIIRITPTYIVSLGVDDAEVQPAAGQIPFHGRRGG